MEGRKEVNSISSSKRTIKIINPRRGNLTHINSTTTPWREQCSQAELILARIDLALFRRRFYWIRTRKKYCCYYWWNLERKINDEISSLKHYWSLYWEWSNANNSIFFKGSIIMSIKCIWLCKWIKVICW